MKFPALCATQLRSFKTFTLVSHHLQMSTNIKSALGLSAKIEHIMQLSFFRGGGEWERNSVKAGRSACRPKGLSQNGTKWRMPGAAQVVNIASYKCGVCRQGRSGPDADMYRTGRAIGCERSVENFNLLVLPSRLPLNRHSVSSTRIKPTLSITDFH